MGAIALLTWLVDKPHEVLWLPQLAELSALIPDLGRRGHCCWSQEKTEALPVKSFSV